MHAELFALVAELVKHNDKNYMIDVIQHCHNGRLYGFVTNDNLHLFRRYRNTVTGNARQLIKDAVKGK